MIAKNFRTILKNHQAGRFVFSSKKQRFRDQFEEINRINEFDQQVKQKYLNKQYLNENFKNMDVKEIKARIQEEYEAEADKIQQEDSILNEIRSDMFESPELRQQKKKLEELQKERQLEPMEKYFSNLDNHEFLKRARELQLDIDFHRLPDPEKRTNSISRDYANYSSYEQNKAQYKDLQNEWEEYPDQIYQGKRIMKFIDNLDNDIQDKKELREQLSQLKNTNSHLTEDQLLEAHFDNEAEKIQKRKNTKHEFDLGENDVDEDEGMVNHSERLSPKAKEEIFRLYIQGWSVRDISSRFGIVPERVKAVVWLRQKFYFEVLPNVDIACLKHGMELEQDYNQEHAYVDYGIDLEELSRRNTGIITPSFKKAKDVDVRALKFQEERKSNLIEKVKRKGPRNSFVTSEFKGTFEKGYYYKDWIVNRGRGSDKVNTKFKHIVEMSKTPERLPRKVREKLSQGPRIASQNYGFK